MVICIRRPLIFCCIIELIFCLLSIYGAKHIAPSYFSSVISETEKTQSIVTGNVVSVKQTEFGINYQLSDCMIQIQDCSCEHSTVLVNSNSIKEQYHIGDTICVSGGLRSFPGARNDGEFNQKLYYQSIGIQYRIAAEYIEVIKESSGMPYYLNQIKSSLDSHLHSISTEEDYGTMMAVLLGDKSSLSQDIYQLLQKNGIAHLIAISGLHVSFFGLAVYKLLRKCGFGFLTSFTISFLFLVGYAALTGNGVSARRAVIMCVLQMGASILGRTYDTLSALALSAMLFLTENMYICFHSGFLMSFLAILGILIVVPSLNNIFIPLIDKKAKNVDKKRNLVLYYFVKCMYFIIKSLIGSLGISIFMLPVMMYYYFEVPLYGVFLNIIVIPLMSLLLFCGAIALIISYICMPIGAFLMGTVHYILKFYVVLCEAAQKLPFSTIQTPRPQMWQIVLFYVFIGLMAFIVWLFQSKIFINKLKNKYKKNKINIFKNICSIICFIVAIMILFYKEKVSFTVDMLDVGQGDCILIRNKDINMLFDGGSTDISKVGEKRIYPLLRSYGINKMDYIFISHSDSDHVNGIMELMDLTDKTFTIKNLVLPDIISEAVKTPDASYIGIIEKAKEKGIHIIYATTGWGIRLPDEMDIMCLHPSLGYPYESVNDYSAVYRVTYKDFSILMTGDVEKKGELNMLKENELSKIMILKTAHHGSSSSSDIEFLKRIQPQIAIISCGINNRYGHPSSQTIENLKECGTKIYSTPETGQIKITVGDKGIKVQTYLEDK